MQQPSHRRPLGDLVSQAGWLLLLAGVFFMRELGAPLWMWVSLVGAALVAARALHSLYTRLSPFPLPGD